MSATLDQIGQAARQAAPMNVPTGSFIHRQSVSIDLVVRPGSDLGLDARSVSYLLPSESKSWEQSETGFVMTNTTVGEPTFFDERVASAYAASGGRSLDRVGEVVEERFTDVADPIGETDWPTETSALRSAMEAALAQGADTRQPDIQMFDLAIDILRGSIDPMVRAAVIGVISGLDITSAERRPDGSVTVSLIDRTTPATEMSATISEDGVLIRETVVWLEDAEGIPAGTVISQATHDPPVVVQQLPAAP